MKEDDNKRFRFMKRQKLVKARKMNKRLTQSMIGIFLSMVVSLIIIYLFNLMIFGEGAWSIVGAISGGIIAPAGFRVARLVSQSTRSVIVGGGIGIVLFAVYAYGARQEIAKQINGLIIVWFLFQSLTLIFFPNNWLRQQLQASA